MDLAQKPVYKLDLAAGTSVVNLTTPLVEGDDRAQTFTLELTDKGTPANLDGYSVTAYFGRGKTAEAEADTIPLSGTVSGNVATITLTESCYSRSCYFSMPIRLSNGATGQKRTYLIARGTVVKSVDGKIIDPDGSVPSLDDLFAQIAVMERSRQAAEEAAEEALAAATRADEAREGIQGDLATLSQEISGIDKAIVEQVKSRNLIDLSKSTQGGYVGPDGIEAANASYDCSDYIYVGDSVGKNIYFSVDGAEAMCRFVCAYDNGKNVMVERGSDGLASVWTVTEGVAYVRITYFAGAYIQAEYERITTPTSYFVNNMPKTAEQVKTSCFGFKPFSVTGDLGSGETMLVDTCFSKKNNVFYFYGEIGTFNGVKIGHGVTNTQGYHVEITPTEIFWNSPISNNGSLAHGLDFKDYICVVIENSDITITTNGGRYTRTETWYGQAMDVFATASNGTVLTGCTLSFVPQDAKKPIWYFGDSYISIAETRWPYWLGQYGYLDNIMLDGYAGGTSAIVYNDVVRLLEIAKPRCIIWALGMNDTDKTSVNVAWYNRLTMLRELCDKNNIELILCTIPNTPTFNNVYKNAIVRSSGLRYIDYAKAVNAESANATWYDGMLSSDQVHPTEEGAKALANQLLKDFPQIMLDY